MQHKQDNYKVRLGVVLLLAAGVFGSPSARSASNTPDPILSDGPSGPCDPQTASADYVGGTDVKGNPVAGADLDRAPIPVPSQMELPVRTRRGTAYVAAGGPALAPLLNPPPGCAPPVQPRPQSKSKSRPAG